MPGLSYISVSPQESLTLSLVVSRQNASLVLTSLSLLTHCDCCTGRVGRWTVRLGRVLLCCLIKTGSVSGSQ